MGVIHTGQGIVQYWGKAELLSKAYGKIWRQGRNAEHLKWDFIISESTSVNIFTSSVARALNFTLAMDPNLINLFIYISKLVQMLNPMMLMTGNDEQPVSPDT